MYDYPVLKIFEVPACYSALFCDYIPELGELGFVPNENMVEITEDMLGVYVEMVKSGKKIKPKAVFDTTKRKEFIKFIRSWLVSPDLKRITENGFELVHSRHTDEIRAKKIVEELKEIKV